MIVLQNVTKVYGERKVLSRVSLRIEPQEFLCIAGSAASGKSTLLRLLLRQEDPTNGSIEADGADLKMLPPPILQLYRRHLGLVFQDLRLLPHLTIVENIAAPLELTGMSPAHARNRASRALKDVGLSGRSGSRPEELSAGEQALAALARALAGEPKILLIDDLLGHLDHDQAALALKLLGQAHTKGASVLFLARDSSPVRERATRILELKDGKLVEPPPEAVPVKEPSIEFTEVPGFPPLPATKKKVKITAIGPGM